MNDNHPEPVYWFTARKGSTLQWFPKDAPLGIIEIHPEHQPIMHWMGGPDEVLKPSPSGAYIIDMPPSHTHVTVSIGKPEDHTETEIIMNFMEIPNG